MFDELNYLVIFGLAVLSVIIGFVWYGFLFRKVKADVIDLDLKDENAKKEMQKRAIPFTIIRFVLFLFQIFVLAIYIKTSAHAISGLSNALWIWAAFVAPVILTMSMCTKGSYKKMVKHFLLEAGYTLILFIIFGYVLGIWHSV